MQGTDNSYYLKHLYTEEYNGAGSIFLDSRNSSDLSDRHTVIYGHHLKNGAMFSSLTGYKKQDYYEAHPTLYLMTPEKNYEIKVFAGYVASVKDDAWQLNFDCEESFQAWIGRAIENPPSAAISHPQAQTVSLRSQPAAMNSIMRDMCW